MVQELDSDRVELSQSLEKAKKVDSVMSFNGLGPLIKAYITTIVYGHTSLAKTTISVQGKVKFEKMWLGSRMRNG